jgi:hypothetical protein
LPTLCRDSQDVARCLRRPGWHFGLAVVYPLHVYQGDGLEHLLKSTREN